MNLDEMQIRLRAYAIWEQEGRPEGREAAHWERAVTELAGNENGPTRKAAANSRKSVEKKPARKKAA